MTDKQYDGMILENLEDLEDITTAAKVLPDSKEKEAKSPNSRTYYTIFDTSCGLCEGDTAEQCVCTVAAAV